MDYRILGPLEVRDGSRPLALGGERQRAVLAILVLHRNEVVSADRLIDELWGESPPPGARQTVRAYVSKLRRAMAANGASPAVGGDSEREPGDGVLLTRGHGYVLEVLPGELDLDRFAEAAERGRDALATGRPADAARLLRESLALWRGAPLAEFSYEGFAQTAIAQLEELHLGAVEERVEADLVLGQARELVGELRDLVARHPLRERLRGQLMLAFTGPAGRPRRSRSTRTSAARYLMSWGSSPAARRSSSRARSSTATPPSTFPPGPSRLGRANPGGRYCRLSAPGDVGGR